MIIYYNLITKAITRTEDNTVEALTPFNMTFEARKEYYESQGEGFVSLPFEMGSYILNFNLGFDVDGNFTGLIPK